MWLLSNEVKMDRDSELEDIRFRQLRLIGRLSITERAEVLSIGSLPYYEEQDILTDGLQRALLWKMLRRVRHESE